MDVRGGKARGGLRGGEVGGAARARERVRHGVEIRGGGVGGGRASRRVLVRRVEGEVPRGGVLRGSSLRARVAVVARLEERRDGGDARRGRRRSRDDRREVVRLGERDGVERASHRRPDGASVLRLGLGRRPGALHRSTHDDAARVLRRHRRRDDESDLHLEGARERRGVWRRR